MPAATNTNSYLLQETRYVPLSYNNADSHKSALRLCLTLFPEWEDSEGPIEFIRFKDGITNTLLKAIKRRPHYSEEQIDKEAVLVRAYGNGTEILIDRQRELTAHCLLAQNGLAPPLLARFNNGLIYEFVRGHVCSPSDLATESVWRGVARELAHWHALLPIASTGSAAIMKDDMEISLGSSPPALTTSKETLHPVTPKKPIPNIWTVMAKWILALPTSSAIELERKETLDRELKRTITELVDTPGLGGNGFVFGHCDLLSGNVIVLLNDQGTTPGSRRGPATVNFIDYEYATPSPAAFDIANHFSEWGGFDCDYSALPTRSVRRAFIDEYVAGFTKHSVLEHDSDRTLSERLFNEIDRFRGVPGLYWGIWALIQATISQIDFDYASYAQVRLKEYWDWRKANENNHSNIDKPISLREERWAEE